MADAIKYPCPCCGYLLLERPPGSHNICKICFWEDDLSQLRFPHTGGANRVSLFEAQRNFDKFGASELRLVSSVRRPVAEDIRDSEWRPIDENMDDLEMPQHGTEYGGTYPKDPSVLYYWRRTYWRRGAS